MELILDKNKKKEHLYLEVFHYYRELIMEKKLPPGSRMPSLRKCSQELKLSRTTIEMPICSWLRRDILFPKLRADIM
mgnify:CR=1 FL=1